MKYGIMQHLIWLIIVCKNTGLRVSRIQRVKVFCLLVLYFPVNNFSVISGQFLSTWVEPVLCKDLSVLLQDTVPPMSLTLVTPQSQA